MSDYTQNNIDVIAATLEVFLGNSENGKLNKDEVEKLLMIIHNNFQCDSIQASQLALKDGIEKCNKSFEDAGENHRMVLYMTTDRSDLSIAYFTLNDEGKLIREEDGKVIEITAL